MTIAPFIRPIKLQGGTFYSFSSAVEDFNSTFGTAENNIRFSKFALLNLPQIGVPTNGKNFIQFNAIPGAHDEYGSSITQDLNTTLAESFQNYCLNLETGIILDDRYDPTLKRTVSERVFFKWLKEIGAIRFREATQSELNGFTFGSRFVEEDQSDMYEQVIKHIGYIDVMNNVRNKFNAYTEAYIHVPSSHGSSPYVLFDAIPDDNYAPSTRYQNKPKDPLDDEYIWGRAHTDVHPAGLDFHAHYDSDSGFNNFWSFDEESSTYVQYGDPAFKWWYDTPQDSTMYIEPIAFGNATTEKFAIGLEDPNVVSNLDVVRFSRSKLDGITIDFNPDAYKLIQEEYSNGSLGDFNSSAHSEEFEFNAVLVYYDVESKRNSTDKVSNLFGVLFLDNVDPYSTGGGKIPTLTKYRPNSLIKANGNSYAFKLNVKWDTSGNDTGVEVSVNDYSTFSLQLYIDALNEMVNASQSLQKNIELLNDIDDRVSVIEDLATNAITLENVVKEIDDIKQLINDNDHVFLNNENILAQIQKLYAEVRNIYSNKTSVEMSYNLDLLREGRGILLDRTTEDEVRIHSAQQRFNINNSIISITDFEQTTKAFELTKKLDNFSNYLRIRGDDLNTSFESDRNIILNIDDSSVAWKKGQTYRISFEPEFELSNTNGNFFFYIFTDALNKSNENINYSVEIASIPYFEFDARNNKPVIEITCINPETFEFLIDIF